MQRTRMMAAALMLAMGSAAGLASAQDAMTSQSPAEIIAAEMAHIEAPEVKPTLMPGDAAPGLKVATFVKGAPISEFEAGSAYLVDFWATWCGPCIASIPKLTELQGKYADDNFTVLAVSVWERPTGDALIDHVTTFVDSRDEDMGYTIAIDDEGQMASEWIEAAGQQGIPTAMIVNREGKVAWIGYGTDPAMSGVLDSVINDSWDLDMARSDREKSILEMSWYRHFASLAKSDKQRAASLAAALHAEDALVTPGLMNAMAWGMVGDDTWGAEAHAAARDLAQSAIDAVGDDAATLDTLAWAHYRLGETDTAIEIQTRAIDAAAGDEKMQADLMQSLETFKSGG